MWLLRKGITVTSSSGDHDNVIDLWTTFDIVVIQNAVVVEQGLTFVVQLDVIALDPVGQI